MKMGWISAKAEMKKNSERIVDIENESDKYIDV